MTTNNQSMAMYSSATQQQDTNGQQQDGKNGANYNTNRLNARQQMNIGVLKRKDKFITTIHSTFDHVVFYKFQDDSWDKLEVEGAMFIVERNEPKFPKYRIVVMNRKSSDDFRQDITKDLELEVHHPYVFYRTKGRIIKGIWFYKSLQCIEFNDLIVSLKEKAYGKTEPESKQSNTFVQPPTTLQPSPLINYHPNHADSIYHPSSQSHQINHHQNDSQPSSDASSLLKNMLGIGGVTGLPPVENGSFNPSSAMDGNNYLDEESLIREHFFNSSANQQVSTVVEPEYSSVLSQECVQQFGKRKFVTKEMFINQLMFTLESNKDFSDACYNQYCQFLADENKQSGNRC